MKHFSKITIFLLGLNFSCNSIAHKSHSEGFRILKTEKLKDYNLITFTNVSDTILGVAKKDISENCILKQIANYGAEKNYEKIGALNDKGDSIIFVYKMTEITNRKLYTGSGAPGQLDKTYIDSYNSSPIVLKKCE